jgi:hypothetical protein
MRPACPCRYTSTPAEVMFLYEEVYSQQQYLQHGVTLKPGDTVMDVGGNIGLFAMLAAEVTDSVQAPTPLVHTVVVSCRSTDAHLVPCQVVGSLGCVVSLEPAPHTAAALAANLEHHSQWCAQHGKEVNTSLLQCSGSVWATAYLSMQVPIESCGSSGWHRKAVSLTPMLVQVARNVVLPLAVTDDPAAKTASFTVYNR